MIALVDFDEVWHRYCRRARHIPQQDLADIAEEARSQRALTFETEDGLIVLTLTPGPDGLELFLLLAVSIGTPGAYGRQESTVLNIARDLGACAVAFIPQRAGWSKLLGPDWIARGEQFVRPVDGQKERRHSGDPPATGDG